MRRALDRPIGLAQGRGLYQASVDQRKKTKRRKCTECLAAANHG